MCGSRADDLGRPASPMPATAVAYKMRNRCFLLAVVMLLCGFALATSTLAAENPSTQPEHEGVSLKPRMLVQFGGFGITNSMLVTWLVAAGIIIFSQIATRRVKAIPSGIQNFWEWLVEGLHNFLENIIGRELVAKGFWFFATIFIFILFVNWFGLIPGIGTIGWGHYDGSGNFHVDRPLLRGGNADLNMTTAMSAIFFVMWFVWAIQANGIGGFLKHLFGPKGETSGIVKILMIVIFFAVGGLADPVLFPRSARGICAGACFHATDCGFHNVDCRTPGGTGARALIFRRSHDEIAKPTKLNMILPILAELGGSIHVGLAAMGVGIGIGLTGLGMTTAVGRNPGAFTQVLVHGILAIALTEAIVFYALYLVH